MRQARKGENFGFFSEEPTFDVNRASGVPFFYILNLEHYRPEDLFRVRTAWFQKSFLNDKKELKIPGQRSKPEKQRFS